MKNLINILIQVRIIVGVMCVIILILFLMFSEMNIQGWIYAKRECDKLNGSLIIYECYNYPYLPCEKFGEYCKLNNGSEIDLTIRNIRN